MRQLIPRSRLLVLYNCGARYGLFKGENIANVYGFFFQFNYERTNAQMYTDVIKVRTTESDSWMEADFPVDSKARKI